jgi:RNA polymerase sigma factor (TIGR02999 family)
MNDLPASSESSRSCGLNEPENITQLLQLASQGDRQASDELFGSVYRELRIIARAHRQRWHGNDTISTTALINEAYLKLAAGGLSDYRGRSHFFATASKAMRQVLMTYAERMSAAKRGGDALRVTLAEDLFVEADMLGDLLYIEELLQQLEQQNDRQCRLFECRVFGGMTIEETADALDVSPSTVKRDWALVSAWIYRELDARK